METGETRETGVGVLDKAMSILLVVASDRRAWLPQEIAERTGLSLPTVYRLAQALSKHGLLMKEESRFRLGMTLLRLGLLAAEGIDVRRQALPHLRWLNEQTGENAELHMRQDAARMVVEVVNSPHNLRPFAEVGALLPLHRGAAGKVLLAWLPREQRRQFALESAARLGEERTFDFQALLAELDRVRGQGWASSEGERSAGVAAFAAPIFAAAGDVAGAMTLVVPSSRLNHELRARAIPLVREAARRASSDMGYAGATKKGEQPQ
ncbi:MAG: IclR family transcriptional regulator [Ktedonobacteraceae bacterium]|nr:IclR family transcriptional regulator [Ktedonobacteraceae bacterium]